jgi:hypothetical protein
VLRHSIFVHQTSNAPEPTFTSPVVGRASWVVGRASLTVLLSFNASLRARMSSRTDQPLAAGRRLSHLSSSFFLSCRLLALVQLVSFRLARSPQAKRIQRHERYSPLSFFTSMNAVKDLRAHRLHGRRECKDLNEQCHQVQHQLPTTWCVRKESGYLTGLPEHFTEGSAGCTAAQRTQDKPADHRHRPA